MCCIPHWQTQLCRYTCVHTTSPTADRVYMKKYINNVALYKLTTKGALLFLLEDMYLYNTNTGTGSLKPRLNKDGKCRNATNGSNDYCTVYSRTYRTASVCCGLNHGLDEQRKHTIHFLNRTD